MPIDPLLPLPGVDPATAPAADDPGYSDWLARVAFSPEGVDRMQIWEMLHATPSERLVVPGATPAESGVTWRLPEELVARRAGDREHGGVL